MDNTHAPYLCPICQKCALEALEKTPHWEGKHIMHDYEAR